MATYASTVAQNENIRILRGKGIGGATANLPKPEKKYCKDTEALKVDLPKPAKCSGSTAVEASSLEQKLSQQGTRTTEKAQASNIFINEEAQKYFALKGNYNYLIEEEIRKQEEIRNRCHIIPYDFEVVDDDNEDINMLTLVYSDDEDIDMSSPDIGFGLEPESLSPFCTGSPDSPPTSDFLGSIADDYFTSCIVNYKVPEDLNLRTTS